MSSAKEPIIPYLKNNKWGYADTTGQLLYKATFDSAGFFDHHKAKVYLGEKVGFLDSSLKFLIARPEYDKLRWVSKVDQAEDVMIAKKNGKYGVISAYEELLVPYQYKDIRYFKRKVHFFYCTNGKEVEVYTVKRNIPQKVLSKRDSIVKYHPSWSKVEFVSRNKRFTFSQDGKLLSSMPYKTPKEYGDLMADMPDDMEIEEEIGPYGGMKPKFFSVKEKVGAILLTRKYNRDTRRMESLSDTIPAQYDSLVIPRVLKGKLLVKKDNHWGILTYKNEITVPIKCEEIRQIGIREFALKMGEKWGAVKLTDDVIPHHLLPFKYDNIQMSYKGWSGDFVVSKGEKRFYIFKKNLQLEIPLGEHQAWGTRRTKGFRLIRVKTAKGNVAYIGENGVYFFEE